MVMFKIDLYCITIMYLICTLQACNTSRSIHLENSMEQRSAPTYSSTDRLTHHCEPQPLDTHQYALVISVGEVVTIDRVWNVQLRSPSIECSSTKPRDHQRGRKHHQGHPGENPKHLRVRREGHQRHHQGDRRRRQGHPRRRR